MILSTSDAIVAISAITVSLLIGYSLFSRWDKRLSTWKVGNDRILQVVLQRVVLLESKMLKLDRQDGEWERKKTVVHTYINLDTFEHTEIEENKDETTD
jgi:hypothetical protein